MDVDEDKAFQDGVSDFRAGLPFEPARDEAWYRAAYTRGWRNGQQDRADWERGED